MVAQNFAFFAKFCGFSLAAAPLLFHSRHIYRCGAHRASVEESENSMTRAMARATTPTMKTKSRSLTPGRQQRATLPSSEPAGFPSNGRGKAASSRRTPKEKPHAQKTSMGHPASRFQASPISNRHLIHCPELDADLTCTKQTADHISNRQFFAFLELPDSSNAGRGQSRAIPGIATLPASG